VKNHPIKPYIISKGYKSRKRRRLKIGFFIIASIVLPILLYSPIKDYVDEFLKKKGEILKKEEEDKKRNMALTIMDEAKNSARDATMLLEKKVSTAQINTPTYSGIEEVNKSNSMDTSNLSGKWKGSYLERDMWGRDYRIGFEMELKQNNAQITGITTEEKDSRILTARINGTVEGQTIRFVKQYNENLPQSPIGSVIEYEGSIAQDGNSASGTWRAAILSGKWSVSKVSGNISKTKESSQGNTSTAIQQPKKPGEVYIPFVSEFWDIGKAFLQLPWEIGKSSLQLIGSMVSVEITTSEGRKKIH